MPRWLHDPTPARWYVALRRRLVLVGLTMEGLTLLTLLGVIR